MLAVGLCVSNWSLVAQPDSGVWAGCRETLQATCKSCETVYVCVFRRGICPSFLTVNGSFWNSELEFSREKPKLLLKVFAGAMFFISAQVGEVSAGSHQSYCASCGFWVLCCFKNTEELNARLQCGSKGNCGHVCFPLCSGLCQRRRCRWTAAAALRKQGWSRSPAGVAEEPVNLVGRCSSLPLAALWGTYDSLEEGLGCVDREQVMVWEKNFTDRNFWRQLFALKVLSYAF